MATGAEDALAGTWRLESFTFTDADGGVYAPLGELPAGTLTVTTDGYITFSFMAPDRPGFAENDLFGGTEAERAAAAAGYVSFGGPFRVDGDRIVLDVEYSLFPNWVGMPQTRLFRLEESGDRLVLATDGPKLFNGAERRAEARLRRIPVSPRGD